MYVRAGINVVLAHSSTEDTRLKQVFHIDMTVTAETEASIRCYEKNKYKLVGRILSHTFDLSVGGSVIGKVDLPVDNQSIKDMVHGLVVDQANPLLDQGFPLPHSDHFIMKQLSLRVIKHAVQFEANADYIIHIPHVSSRMNECRVP